MEIPAVIYNIDNECSPPTTSKKNKRPNIEEIILAYYCKKLQEQPQL
jgi:hypothetical protein